MTIGIQTTYIHGRLRYFFTLITNLRELKYPTSRVHNFCIVFDDLLTSQNLGG